MSAYVYLLDHRSDNRFKIGKASDVRSRVRQLGLNQFDYGRSRALRVASDTDAFNLEKLLHRAFAKSRLAPAQFVDAGGPRADGDTEWFSHDCKPRLGEFLEQNKDLLEFEYVSGPELQALVEVLPKPPKAPLAAPKATRPLGRNSLTPEQRASRDEDEKRQAGQLADTCVELLRELISLCSRTTFSPACARRGTGLLKGEIAVDIGKPILDKLLDLSFRGHSGYFRFVSSVATITSGPRASFELSLLWPTEDWAGTACGHAAARIAAYDLPVAGWP